MQKIIAEKLEQQAFSPFGTVIEKPGAEHFLINKGKCTRHHALALFQEIGGEGEAALSIFAGQPYDLPHVVDLVERHPLGSQAFYPLSDRPWLVIVCEDDRGNPVAPKAFLASGNQGINLKPNIWHGVLTPLFEPSDFLVMDRVGEGNNLQEYDLSMQEQFEVHVPDFQGKKDPLS